MKLSLSTNWLNRKFERGEEIADKALELGFEELELGFHTTDQQVKGFKARLDKIPVGSVHAFCPVPISAPGGYPELYALASFEEEERKMAHFQIVKNIRFAAEMGADALVLHTGRIKRMGLKFFTRRRIKKMSEIFKSEVDALIPELEKNRVTLGIENMPYLEGFPNKDEIEPYLGDWVKGWFDIGHDFVHPGYRGDIVGVHINDSQGGDDHLAPGMGKVDFAAQKPIMEKARHLVFEPNVEITEKELLKGMDLIRKILT